MADETRKDEQSRATDKVQGNGRAAKRGVSDMASWVLVAAMVVVAGGAAGYIYVHSRATATAAHAHGHSQRHHVDAGNRTKAATSAASAGTAAAKTTSAYYPPLGTPTRPVKGSVVEGFGWQYQKNIGLYRDVPGWALGAATGTPVRAVVGGRVVANWLDPTEGREVVVDSSNGDSIIYGDLASPGPKVGSMVRAGEAFAKVGAPGKLSGVSAPHLFLEVTVAGQPVSPSTLLGTTPGGDVTTTPAAAASVKA